MLPHCEWDCLQILPRVLDEDYLQYCGGDENQREQEVVEEVFEHIPLGGEQLSGVYFIEDLEEDEGVEEKSKAFYVIMVMIAGPSKEEVAFEKHKPQKDDLEDRLNHNVANHKPS